MRNLHLFVIHSMSIRQGVTNHIVNIKEADGPPVNLFARKNIDLKSSFGDWRDHQI
jgi:hypothetical protein